MLQNAQIANRQLKHPVIIDQTSKFATANALDSMKFRRGST
jgi:hypothetical protein